MLEPANRQPDWTLSLLTPPHPTPPGGHPVPDGPDGGIPLPRAALEESFRLLFAVNPHPMWICDLDTLRFLEVNEAAVARYGYSRDEFLAMSITDIRPPEDAPRLLEEVTKPSPSLNSYGEWRHLLKDGRVIDVEITTHHLNFGGRRASLVLAQDVTARKRMEEGLRHQALHDGLTGLPNRTLFQDRLEQALRTARRERKPATLLVMDLDGFKEINDTFGHQYGDRLLCQLAGRLRATIRASDTVARLGGDEFAVILPSTDQDGAIRVVQAIQTTFDTPFVLDDQGLSVGASIGVAVCSSEGDDAGNLLRQADVAMYLAKRANSGYMLYAPERDQHSPARLSLAGNLREAIEHNQLVLYYQPKMSVAEGRVTQVEALVRWEHPEHGLILPNDFIPMAERMGLVRTLTYWVLRAALRQCRVWHDLGHTLNVSVNLSARNLHDDSLVDTIARLIRLWAVSPTWLTVEITETSIMVDPERAMQVLRSLHKLGVRISIDDFGTGYSSLAYLKQLPVDEIKIDRSFVHEMTTKESDAVIVRSVVDLGHNLGLTVVAEGVENLQVSEALATMRCDVIQGFHLSRPVPADDLLAWLNSQRG